MSEININQLSKNSRKFFRYYYGINWEKVLKIVDASDMVHVFRVISNNPKMFPETYQYDLDKIKLEILPFIFGNDE